ncbi:MAG: acyl-CoA dehydrogenase family protein [Chloroflexota bacterium]
MTAETALLEQVTSEILRDWANAHPAGWGVEEAAVGWAPDLWATLDSAGLPLVGIPEQLGGGGGGWPELAAVLRALGRRPAPVPLAESCALAGWLLAASNLPIPPGPLAVAPIRPEDSVVIARENDGWYLRGSAARVPWAAQASAIVVLARHLDRWAVVTVPPSACTIEPGRNLAGEPRDRVTFDSIPLDEAAITPTLVEPGDLQLRAALVRAIQITGALNRLLELCVEYARVRVQFGRPIGRFQAIQHDLARLAGEVVASAAAVDGAVRVASQDGPRMMEVAAAKIRTAEAATLAARIAHQLHGAIGFTQEHQLHRLTTRLWSWRDEAGGEREWALRLGQYAADRGPSGFWEWLTE